ncbi:MAG: hypothetical protein HXK72_00915 [Clostridiales bacterium]|nr:hypothetical protein [Clostridiales bacterium]
MEIDIIGKYDCDNFENRINEKLEDEIINKIIDKNINNFQHQIIKRGEDYYKAGNVSQVIKNKNTFIAKLEGTDYYEVKITIDKDSKNLSCNCTCPCEFSCKHEYAVLLAIKNKKYIEKELKEEIVKNNITLNELIQNIPAAELKQYILKKIFNKNFSDYIVLDFNDFEVDFLKYLPSQSYEYYYNNLYNYVMINDEIRFDCKYIIKDLINSEKYEEAFFIIKAFIEVANDTKHLKKIEILISKYSEIALFLRIIFRKSNDILKNNIKDWLDKITRNNYYDSVYLEDMILNI